MKLLQNLLAADTEEVKYFMELAVKELMEMILKWNDP
jgi:hypothetical protein